MAQKKNARTTRVRRSERKNIAVGQAHIKSTFNNTIVSISDPQGNVISWQSGGTVGFKGSRKSTPYAAQLGAQALVARPQSVPFRQQASRFRVFRIRHLLHTTAAVLKSAVATSTKGQANGN